MKEKFSWLRVGIALGVLYTLLKLYNAGVL